VSQGNQGRLFLHEKKAVRELSDSGLARVRNHECTVATDESLSEKLEYLRQNPVRAGLVERSEAGHTSFNSTPNEFGV
jgi:hypothetical protein